MLPSHGYAHRHLSLNVPICAAQFESLALRLLLASAQAGYELFDLPQEFIDLTFGVVTIVTSIVATLLGGLFIDMVGSSVRNAMAFCGVTALVSLVSPDLSMRICARPVRVKHLISLVWLEELCDMI